VKLRHTLRAAAELDEVLAYIEARSPQGARRVQTRIQLIIDLLLQYPQAGSAYEQGAPAADDCLALSVPDFLPGDRGRDCGSWRAP
jgi:plasmid stabilization system protein ParE